MRKKIENTNAAALIFLTLALIVFQLVTPARGQETYYRINDLKVSVWPEYDDPRVLVIYRGAFEESSIFPNWVDFYIPEGAEINGAGIATPGGELLLQEHEIRREGDRNVISINLSIPTFFLEYYYDPFIGEVQKSFEQKIENKYPVASMAVVVQQPLKAENFSLTPQADSSETDSAGFTNYLYNFSDLAAENSVSFMVSYKKEDPNPSVRKKTIVPQASSAPIPPAAGKTSSGIKTKLKGKTLGGIIFLVLAAVIATALIMRKTKENDVEAGGVQGKKSLGKVGWNYCPGCGAELEKDYKFCPSCGQDVIREK
jgi:hypothetical protein